MQCPAYISRYICSKSGFTLIELMISVGILTLLSAAMIPSFNTYINNQNVSQGLEQVKSDLRSVQNKALTGTEFDRTTNTTYWGMKFGNGSNTYQWRVFTGVINASSCTSAANWSTASTSTQLNSDVVIAGPAHKCVFFSFANGDVLFYNGTAFINCNTSTCSINVKRSSDTSATCRNVIINTPGLIQTNTATVTCTN